MFKEKVVVIRNGWTPKKEKKIDGDFTNLITVEILFNVWFSQTAAFINMLFLYIYYLSSFPFQFL